MQAILRGEDKSKLRAAEMLERKTEYVAQKATEKVQYLQGQLQNVTRQKKQIVKENTMLLGKLDELAKAVQQREAIKKTDKNASAAAQEVERGGIKKKVIGGGGKIQENVV